MKDVAANMVCSKITSWNAYPLLHQVSAIPAAKHLEKMTIYGAFRQRERSKDNVMKRSGDVKLFFSKPICLQVDILHPVNPHITTCSFPVCMHILFRKTPK
jgi:hypothetical protein